MRQGLSSVLGKELLPSSKRKLMKKTCYLESSRPTTDLRLDKFNKDQ